MKYNNFWFPKNDGFDCIIFWLQGLAEEVALHEKQSMKEHVHQTTQQMANIDLYDLDIQKEMQVTPLSLSLLSLSLSMLSIYLITHYTLTNQCPPGLYEKYALWTCLWCPKIFEHNAPKSIYN